MAIHQVLAFMHSDGYSGYPKLGFWVHGINLRNGLSATLPKIFFNIFAMFGDFLKFYSALGMLHFKNSLNMAKIIMNK